MYGKPSKERHWSFSLMFFTEFSDKKLLSLKGLEPATSCGRDQYATTVPARHMWEAGSLNWVQFMPQWFIRFPEFAKFNESSDPLRKNSIGRVNIQSTLAWFTMSAKRMALTILEACGYINSKVYHHHICSILVQASSSVCLRNWEIHDNPQENVSIVHIYVNRAY